MIRITCTGRASVEIRKSYGTKPSLVSAMKAEAKLVLSGMPHKPVPVKYAEPPPKLLL